MVVADHTAFRTVLVYRLFYQPDILVVGHTGAVTAAQSTIQETVIGFGVDVILVDFGLHSNSALDLIRDIGALVSDAAILAIARLDDPEHLTPAVEADAAGLIQRADTQDDIIAAIRPLGADEPLLTPAEVRQWLRLAAEVRDCDRVVLDAKARLSHPEREVLQLLANGCGDNDIVEDLTISYKTVRTQVHLIFAKLGVDSRLQTVVFAARYGAVTIR